jgi:hypothetical protein
MHVPFIWQTKFYTQHELTRICRTLEAAPSSSLVSVFGSIQSHEAAIDTLPKEGIKSHCLRHSFTADNSKLLLKSGHKSFLPNSFKLILFSFFCTLDWMLPVHLDIQRFSIWQIIHYPPPQPLCHLPLYKIYHSNAPESKYFFLYSL